MRWIAEFSKGKAIRYISHLDLQRTMSRALRRAGLPIKYSEGFNPHPVLSFSSALSVGLYGDGQIMDIRLEGPACPEALKDSLNRVLPEAIRIHRVCEIGERAPSPMALVEMAEYQIQLPKETADKLPEAVPAFMAQEAISAIKRTKKGDKAIDLRPLICAMSCTSHVPPLVNLRLMHKEGAAVKPQIVLASLGTFAGFSTEGAVIGCTGMLTQTGEDLFDYLTRIGAPIEEPEPAGTGQAQ